MPELLEVESYRRLAERTVGRSIAEVLTPDAWFVKGIGPEEFTAAVTGAVVEAAERRGKLAWLQLDNGHRLGLRFGMTGRLVVDGTAAIDELVYGARRQDPVWDRFTLVFAAHRGADGGSLVLSDPRRLGGVELDPDLGRLGPDATVITRSELAAVLCSRLALKAVLMDQGRVAGLGNLLTDDVLWRAGLSPQRPANSLDQAEVVRLPRAIGTTLRTLGRRGGSHTGDLQPERHRDGRCPRDGAALDRTEVGGRTTYWCPVHQH